MQFTVSSALTISCTTATCPRLQVSNSAVESMLIRTFISMSCSMSIRHISTCPRCAANMSAVMLDTFCSSKSVACCKVNFTIATCPCCVARITGDGSVSFGQHSNCPIEDGQTFEFGPIDCDAWCNL